MEDSPKRGFRGRRNYRGRAVEAKPEFPEMPYPDGVKITPKHLGYLHVHCRMPIADIVTRFPKRMTTALVHLGLYHYFSNREALDAELVSESKFNLAASLKETAMNLPRAGLASLVDAEEAYQAVKKADQLRKEKENWKPILRVGEPRDS